MKKFTPEEESYIKSQVESYQERARQAELDAEVRNRILDAQRKLPGYKY